ncbi:N-acetylneuraminate synthase [Mucilaginibacter sp. OK098]|uniref:N-acetylneuraminate synthase n=1 Tax=Mucilaginibacter sp. OK098 TaxID=1855297 RepID=UPI0009178BF8|nr:N-acetylneuraminate synthase [Mucilaginibacter sp. OK098]SHL93021.1 N-acetylneuraminate synthase [Mucilaginibacter sp. OK098]
MKRILIIAEAGVNHNGSLENAFKLIDAAKDAGADYVKFQTFKADKLVNKSAQKADYQKTNLPDVDNSQYAMLKKLELTEHMHNEILSYCEKKGIKFLSTPFDQDSIIFLKALGVTIGKIPSGEITNLPYLRQMAHAFPELIVSTGMCTMEEVKDTVDALIAAGAQKENVTVLHCNTEYPTPMRDVNLKAMLNIKEELGIEIGYSDHTMGIEVPIAAVALGATIIEKHFTLDRTMEGPDHPASLEPGELKEMVRCIRNIEQALGGGFKIPSDSEKKNIQIVRKSIVAKVDMVKGATFSEENLTVKRPGTGISPMNWDKVIGQKANKNYKSDEIISL